MRVLLVNPASGGIYDRLGFSLPPLGPAYLAGALRAAGHQVAIADLAAPGSRGEAEPELTGFDLVGLTADSGKYQQAVRIGRLARRTGARVVAGGPHVTFRDEDALTSGAFDYVLRGEADESLVELAGQLAAGRDPAGMAGLSWLGAGGIERGPDRPPPADLDALAPPARDLLPMDAYRGLELRRRPVTSLVTSRGCPHGCAFCCSSRFAGRALRVRSVDAVAAELEEIRGRWGFTAVAFMDDGFAADPDRLARICAAMRRRRLDLLWWCFARADALLEHPELASDMAAAGCRYVFVGLESPDPRALDDYGKGHGPLKARELVALLARHGIETMASYIIGHPGDTERSVRALARFARRLPTGSAQFSILTPFPGTALWDELADRIVCRDWDRFDCLHSTFRLDHLSAERLEALLTRCFTGFYLTPRRILRGLASSLRGRGVKVGAVMRAVRQLGRQAGTGSDGQAGR